MFKLTADIRQLFRTYVQKVTYLEQSDKSERQRIQGELDNYQKERVNRETQHHKAFADGNAMAATVRAGALQRAQSAFDDCDRKVRQLRTRLEGMVLWSEDHMQKQGLKLPAGDDDAKRKSSANSTQAFSNARNLQKKGEEILEEMKKLRRPEAVIWPNNNIAGWALTAAALLVGLLVGYWLDFGFGAGLFFFGLAFLGPIVFLHASTSKKLKASYEEWLSVRYPLEHNIEDYQRQSQKTFKDERKSIDQQHEVERARIQEVLDRDLRATSLKFKENQLKCTQAFASAKSKRERTLDETRAWLVAESKMLHEQCANFESTTGYAGADWASAAWDSWQPPSYPASIARVGKFAIAMDGDQHVFPNVNLNFQMPAVTSFASGRCLLLKATGEEKESAISAVRSLLLRLLATVPPGKVRFTLLDPVGLGQNVAPFMPLADYDDSLIQSRAWTEPQHIEEQLAKLTEHMETVIQKYLRSDYPTIEDYNKQAGEVAEPYRVLTVLDFPVNFTETAARRLVSIARNGPRCGIYTVVVQDTAKKLPYQFNIADLEQSATVIKQTSGSDVFSWLERDLDKCSLTLDAAPPAEIFKNVIQKAGERSIDAMRVQVPYDKLLDLAGLEKNKWWTGTTEKRVHVPLGPTGARKLQYMTLGEGTAHHAIVIGRTGSGKSNLMHVIITTLALHYSPDEMRLYLIDFKQGVEFKPYAEAALPHADVIAIESEREFGLSVLHGLNNKLQERGELFRKIGVNNLTEYRQKTSEKMARILLLVDEFQEFFTQEDNTSRQATMILDRLVRQGRYAGIHVMLGSQNLAASRSIPTSTINQMGIRIALQSSDADARQILAEDNPAARLLSRPGEAIYNAASGLIEGNNFFQVALFTDEDRQKQLEAIGAFARDLKVLSSPRIFEGNESARLEKCQPLNTLIAERGWPQDTKKVESWIGEPIAIKEPTSVRFRRQSGNNLLVVTRDEEEGIGIITATMLGLAAQQGPDEAHFFNVDLTTVDSSWQDVAEDVARLLPHNIDVSGRRDVPRLLKDLFDLLNKRIESDVPEPSVYLIIQGIQRARDLRLDEVRSGFGFGKEEEENTPSCPQLLSKLLREGPDVGIHVIAWCDSHSNLKHVVDPRFHGEFGLRVAGAMSNEDSMHLIDDPAAARLDKPHRAIFYDEERPGYLEKFRPYALPDAEWLKGVAEKMRSRLMKAQSA
jgi:DNA segregation ATPase FtsK/SpoIIIE, S-DNA-T family